MGRSSPGIWTRVTMASRSALVSPLCWANLMKDRELEINAWASFRMMVGFMAVCSLAPNPHVRTGLGIPLATLWPYRMGRYPKAGKGITQKGEGPMPTSIEPSQ